MYFIDLEKSYDHAAHYLYNYFKLKDLRCVPNSCKAISCLHSCFCFFLWFSIKFSILQSLSSPLCNKLCVVTERIRSWIQVAEMNFLFRVAVIGWGRWRSRRSLKVELLLLWIERRIELSMPHVRVPVELHHTCPTGQRPRIGIGNVWALPHEALESVVYLLALQTSSGKVEGKWLHELNVSISAGFVNLCYMCKMQQLIIV